MLTKSRVGIALVGLRLTLTGAGQIAVTAARVVIGCICIALASGGILGRRFDVPRGLAVVRWGGAGVCGGTGRVGV